MRLPSFKRTRDQLRWVEGEKNTAKFIRSLWTVATQDQRRDPGFLCFLIQCGWTNGRKSQTDADCTRRWRNQRLAEFLDIKHVPDSELADELSWRFTGLSRGTAGRLVRMRTGFAHYYAPLRRATLQLVGRKPRLVAEACHIASSRSADPSDKVRRVVQKLLDLGYIRTPQDGKILALNGLSPTLACLDPQRRAPIMNKRTVPLLRALGAGMNCEGAVTLSELIGEPKVHVHNSFELDVYACTEKFPRPRRLPKPGSRLGGQRDLGIKNEETVLAYLSAKKVRIHHDHNSLTTRLLRYVKSRYGAPPKESGFDALLQNWRPGRDLLIEAKTASGGPGGRFQIRLAVGQLFDYRWIHFGRGKRAVDLAVLLPSEPTEDVRSFLRSLSIGVLWFEGKVLFGALPPKFSKAAL